MKKNSLLTSIIPLVLGFYCFISLILLGVGGFFFNKNLGTWGDLFSLGQLLSDLCLIPFAVIAFYLTLQELRKSQEHAELNIGWETSDSISNVHSENYPLSANFFSPSIILNNKGNAPSIHYQITLEVPINIGRSQMRSTGMDWKGDKQGETQRFFFTSAANWISFPHAPYLDLGKMEFTESASLPREIAVKYYIASDKDDYKSGVLTIKFTESKAIEAK